MSNFLPDRQENRQTSEWTVVEYCVAQSESSDRSESWSWFSRSDRLRCGLKNQRNIKVFSRRSQVSNKIFLTTNNPAEVGPMTRSVSVHGRGPQVGKLSVPAVLLS